MTPDPVDRLGKRLFEAARGDLPSEGSEQRWLSAALREVDQGERAPPVALRRVSTMRAIAIAALLAAGLALQLTQQKPSDSIRAEPELARFASPKPSAVTKSVPAASGTSVTAPSIVKPQASAVSHPSPAIVTLSDELGALKAASSALGAGNAQGALAALDRYDQVLKGSKLRAEATLLRIQALARSGNPQAASALAQRFVDQNPNSPLVDRARSFIQSGMGAN